VEILHVQSDESVLVQSAAAALALIDRHGNDSQPEDRSTER
jgi:hypothetical protein